MTHIKRKTSIGVVIPSKGRPEIISQWQYILNNQSVAPYVMIYSVTSDSDLPSHEKLYPNSRIVMGETGASKQRNKGLELVIQQCEFVAFFDDDFVPSDNCLENMEIFMRKNLDVAGANGHLLADGIHGPGIGFEEARSIVKESEKKARNEFQIDRDLVGLHGCNMVFRVSHIGEIRFDEKLPLYSWQEDIDFAVQVGRRGRIVNTRSFSGVHQGIKKSRSAGVRLGYSQIANPIYLMRKGTMPKKFGIKLMARNLLSNHAKSIRPEPWVDRRGRMIGNWIAIKDVLLAKSDPEKILDL